MTTTAKPSPHSSGLQALCIAVVVVAVLPHIPLLSLLVRPLVWLSTLMHEAGHGLVAILVGAGCKSLVISMDGSGVMTRAHGVDAVWKNAAISLGGLIGPAVVSALFCIAGVVPTMARICLVITGVVCVAIAAVYAEGFAVLVCVGWGVVFMVVGAYLRGSMVRIAALVFAVNLALAVFSRSDYLFTGTATTAAGELPSDVANMAKALGGHYLVWGVVVAAISVLLLAVGMMSFFGGEHVRLRWQRYFGRVRNKP